MKLVLGLKIIIIFQLSLSLSNILSTQISGIRSVRGTGSSDPPWYPAGPAMDGLTFSMFGDQVSELNGFDANAIDFTDVPLSSTLLNFYQSSNYPITNPAPQASISGLDFNMANTFWNCNFETPLPSQDPPQCSVEIRQGIAHLIDKTIFAANQGNIQAVPVDNPVGAALTPDPCSWDSTFPQTGSACQVNGIGGTAYHLDQAKSCAVQSGCSSTPTFAWTPGLGTLDLCAAAKHFVQAGLASNYNHNTCVLSGLSNSLTNMPVHIFVRLETLALRALGQSIAQGICALFTGTFSTGCSVSNGPLLIVDNNAANAFPGFQNILGAPNRLWWIYTSGGGTFVSSSIIGDERVGPESTATHGPIDFSGTLIDLSQSFTNTASAIPGTTCIGALSNTPADYGSICDPALDNLINQIASSPCASAPGDPATGQTSATVTFGTCPQTSQLSMASALYKAENRYGQKVWTIPVYQTENQYVYPSSWSSASNGRTVNSYGGTFAYFNWLDAYSLQAASSGTPIRQGFTQSTAHLNPYAAVTPWDFAALTSVYDSLEIRNPSDSSQLIAWMDLSDAVQIPNSELGYNPPPGTVASFRYQLRHDLYWQFASSATPSVPGSAAEQVTPWDVKFSYATLAVNNSLAAAALQSLACTRPACLDAVTVLSSSSFDIHVTQASPAIKGLVSSIPIIPGEAWSPCGPTGLWLHEVNNGTIGTVTNNCLTVGQMTLAYPGHGNCTDPTDWKTDPCYDPILDSTFVGSGPWVCKTTSGVGGGCSCAQSGDCNNFGQNPGTGGSISLIRYGKDQPPGGSLKTYFRSNGNLALWIWTGNTGDFNHDGQLFSIIASCVNVIPVPAKCAQWGMGIGNSLGTSNSLSTITTTQTSIVFRFQGINWVSTFDWRTLPPTNIAPLPPVLYEGKTTLNPSTTTGCTTSYASGGGYDC